jgi:hypothetical protein
MKQHWSFLWALAVVAGLLCTSLRVGAQQPDQQEEPEQQPDPWKQPDKAKPKPAGRDYAPQDAYGPQDADQDQPGVAAALAPDTHALTGVQVLTLGSSEMPHSYWVAGLAYTNFAHSSTNSGPTVNAWNTTNYATGSLSLLQGWTHSQLAVNYSGGGFFSSDAVQGNGYFQQLELMQAFAWKKWRLSLIDQFSYLPQSQFGFGASTNLATPGVGGSLAPPSLGLQLGYAPDQSIFSSIGSRYSNSATAQVVYVASARSSVTFSGSYGVLHFLESGNIDTNDLLFSTGYNYALSKKDTIGVLYRFIGFRYPGIPQAINDHVAQLAYGRRVTGRLALQLFVGPEVTAFRVPVGASSNRVSGSGGGNLTYALTRTSLSLSYYHGVSGGSGVFTGTSADQFQGTVSRRFSRAWNANVNLGLAINGALGGANPTGASQSSTYDSFFVGGGVSRPLGRDAGLTLGYTAYIQNSNLPVCIPGACSYVEHQVSLSFQWRTRPNVLR